MTVLSWHQAPLDQWQRYLEAGQMPHALLLVGPAGVGKREFADRLAAQLFCERAYGRPIDPCGDCNGCRQRIAGSHADLLVVEKPEGKQQISIDQVRTASSRLQLSSHSGGYKLLIIDEAERLNFAAANSLLKTLEEPTDKTLLLLVCSAPNQLPATIRSRCQNLTFHAPQTAEAAEWLSSRGVAASKADLALVLEIAGGAPMAAAELLESGYPEQANVWREGLLRIVDGRADPVKLAEQWFRDAAPAVVNWLQHWSKALLLWQTAGRPSALLEDLPEEQLSRLAARLQPEGLLHYQTLLQQAERALRGSANAQMQLEGLLLAWIGKTVPLVRPVY